MFSIPLLGGVQMPGLFGGTLIIPGAGAFIAALLIAALVGSGLGLLRQATSPHTGTAERHPTIAPSIDHEDHPAHRRAA